MKVATCSYGGQNQARQVTADPQRLAVGALIEFSVKITSGCSGGCVQRLQPDSVVELVPGEGEINLPILNWSPQKPRSSVESFLVVGFGIQEGVVNETVARVILP